MTGLPYALLESVHAQRVSRHLSLTVTNTGNYSPYCNDHGTTTRIVPFMPAV